LALATAAVAIIFYRYFIAAPGPQPLVENEEPPAYAAATLLFAGDVMVHETQFDSVYAAEDDCYNFDPWFEKVKPLVKAADLAVVNLEATLAGAEQVYSGYPTFNTPESLAGALKNAGFDLVSTANNHCLDRGEYGVLKTLAFLEEAGLKSFGTYRSRQERDQALIVEVNGIKAAFLAYTYGTNGIPRPENKEYLVNMLEPELIINDIHRTRGEADLVIVCLHWGLEYQRQPGGEQRNLAARLLEEGADMIIGNHPHVIQPLEFIKFNRSGEQREGPVAYALGNFTGDQIDPYTDTGIMLFVRVIKDKTRGRVELTEITYIPTWIHRFYHAGRRHFRVLPLIPGEEYRRQLQEDPYLTGADLNQIEEIQDGLKEHLRYVPQGLPSDYNY